MIVGDVDTEDALRRAERHFGKIPTGRVPSRPRTVEPAQVGERRVTIEKEGTTAYLKLAYHAPEVKHPDFFPMLVLDAVLTGAKGVNLWSCFRDLRSGGRGCIVRWSSAVATAVNGAMLPTKHPFLYAISVDGARKASGSSGRGSRARRAGSRSRRSGITAAEVERAKAPARARLVFESDSVTNIAHQLGYFETIAHVDVYTSLEERIAWSRVRSGELGRYCCRRDSSTVGNWARRPVRLDV